MRRLLPRRQKAGAGRAVDEVMRSRTDARDLSGVLLLDKPGGMSSNFALQRAKRLFRARKAGHTGTLDPLATGLLPVCLGEATKFGAYLLDSDKGYLTEVRLGARTDTGDADGEIVERRPVGEMKEADILEVLRRFSGPQTQIPPMYSALKRDGRPLYELARAGIVVDRPPRNIVIHSIAMQHWSREALTLEVLCSKGTYIRVLAEDIGNALGCGAHVGSLRRTRVGPFSIAEAISMEVLEEQSDPERDGLLLPTDSLLQGFPGLDLDTSLSRRFCCGMAVDWLGGSSTAGIYRVYGGDAELLGLGELSPAGRLEPKRLLSTAGRSPDDPKMLESNQ